MAIQEIVTFLIGVLIGLSVGIPVGYFLGGRKVNINLRIFAGFLVLVIWGTFLLVSLIDTDIEVPVALHGIAGGVVSALFGEEYFKKD